MKNRKFMTQKRRDGLSFVALSAVTAAFIFPVFWALITSLKLHRDIFVNPPKLLFTPTLANYRRVLFESDYLHFMMNSAVIATTGAFLAVILGTLGAYALTRYKIRGARHLLLWILSLRMIPPMAVVVPFYLMAISSGLYGSRLALVIVAMTLNLPIAVWMQVSYLREIPIQIEEAALVDGCSRLGAFVRIVLPLEAPGLVATAVMCLIFAWNEFPLSVVLSSEASKTLPVSMLSWDTQRGLLWGELMASSMMAIAPVFVFATFIQRYLVRGLTLGAVVE